MTGGAAAARLWSGAGLAASRNPTPARESGTAWLSVVDATMDDVAILRTPFVGRTGELARLDGLLAAAERGTFGAALIAGDAGVGKTRLVGELARRAAERGVVDLVGRCVDLGAGGLSYLPFAEALTQLTRAATTDDTAARALGVVREEASRHQGLARLVGQSGSRPVATGQELGRADDGLERLALFDGVAAVLTRLARDVAPVLLIIEDLHWADASTRDLVRFLLTRLDGERVFMVVTYRSDDLHRRHPLRPLLAELNRIPALERIELAPFVDGELSVFIAAVGGMELPDEVRALVAQRSGGNAYYAEELLAAGSTGGPLPAVLADVLLERFERLAPDTQQVMRAAAVIGHCRIADSVLREAAGLSGPAADEALREAVAHHVLEPDGLERYCFRHALLQEAVYADLLPGERVRLHAAVARALADQGPRSAGEQARHSLAAHDLPGALGASLTAAGEATRRLAPAEALVHYEQVLQLWSAVPEVQRPAGAALVDILMYAAAAAHSCGELDRSVALAEEARREAHRSGTPQQVAAAGVQLAQYYYAVERLPDALQAAREAKAALPAGESSVTKVLADSIHARVHISVGAAEEGLPIAEEALEEARRLGALSAEADLLVTLSVAHGTLGSEAQAEADLAAARERAEQARDHNVILRAAYNLGVNRIDAGDAQAAIRILEAGLAEATEAGLGTSPYGVNTRWMIANAMYLSGDWDGVLALMESARRDVPPVLADQLQIAALPVLVARDATAALPEIEIRSEAVAGLFGAASLESARAQALAWVGDVDGVLAAVERGYAVYTAQGEPLHLAGIALSATAVAALADRAEQARARGEAAAAANDQELGARYVEDGRRRAALGRPRLGTMGPEGRAWLIRLNAEAARLTSDAEPEQWRRTVEAFSYGHPYELARSRRRLAEALLRAGDRDGARENATAAWQAARDLGARPLREAIEELARRARLDVVPAPDHGGVLTRREREVMRLVAQGLTNRQVGERLFISEKTASVHVSNVLAKLGASGRAEAVAIVTRKGLLEDGAAATAS